MVLRWSLRRKNNLEELTESIIKLRIRQKGKITPYKIKIKITDMMFFVVPYIGKSSTHRTETVMGSRSESII